MMSVDKQSVHSSSFPFFCMKDEFQREFPLLTSLY